MQKVFCILFSSSVAFSMAFMEVARADEFDDGPIDGSIDMDDTILDFSCWPCGHPGVSIPGSGGNPVTIPGLPNLSPALAGAYAGVIAAGPVGAAVGALLNDKLATEQTIKKLRDENRNQEADLLAKKEAIKALGDELNRKTGQLTCQTAIASMVPTLQALYGNFQNQLANAADGSAADAAWSAFQGAYNAIFSAASLFHC